ncbi:energy transducer TonB [Candidatus Margulisiibacteriota bacterium]
MKTKALSLVPISLALLTAVAVSYLVSRPAIFVRSSTTPVFMGGEVTVQRAAVKPAAVVKARTVAKAVSQPLPQPKIAAPLPIVPPSVTFRLLPEYPVSALEQGLGGTALLAVYVGLNGSAQKVEVRTSSGVTELDAAAVKAVSEWKFNPARQGGAALASWFEFPLKFEVK